MWWFCSGCAVKVGVSHRNPPPETDFHGSIGVGPTGCQRRERHGFENVSSRALFARITRCSYSVASTQRIISMAVRTSTIRRAWFMTGLDPQSVGTSLSNCDRYFLGVCVYPCQRETISWTNWNIAESLGGEACLLSKQRSVWRLRLGSGECRQQAKKQIVGYKECS